MLKINLLPVKQLKQRAAARNQLIAAGFAILALILFLGLSGYVQSTIIKGLQSDIAQLNNYIKEQASTLAKIKHLEQRKAELERRIDVINKLKKNSTLTVRVMDEVANLVDNNRMWLTSFSQNGMSLSMNGVALDNKTIAIFMDALKNSPFVNRQTVALGSSTLKKVAGRSLKSFSLRCSITPPPQKSPPKKAPAKQNKTA